MDWNEIVRNRLHPVSKMEDAETIVSELAAHLEETYQAARSSGLTHDAALGLTLREVRNWRVLANDISRARSEDNFMTNRTRTLWLPATANLLAAMLLLMIMQRMGVQPLLLWVNAIQGKFALVFYIPWLTALPFLGAAGTYLSRRAQGDTFARLTAGLSPALTLIALICMIAPWSLLVDGLSIYRLVLIAGGLLSWGALPACALLTGALPFLRGGTPSEIVIGDTNHA